MTLTAKGEHRRQALLEAVVRVLEREGPSGVTHRAVAAEAGLPLAAATYYFDSIDDLLVSALRQATEHQVALLNSLARGDLGAFAAVMHNYTHAERASTIAQYELLFLAMRRDSLRPSAELWYRALEEAVGQETGDPVRARVAALAIDGLLLQILWRGEPATVPAIEAALREILGA